MDLKQRAHRNELRRLRTAASTVGLQLVVGTQRDSPTYRLRSSTGFLRGGKDSLSEAWDEVRARR